jgi:hypothetical protein
MLSAMAGVLLVSALPCRAVEPKPQAQDEEIVWLEDEPMPEGTAQSHEQMVERMLARIRETNPEKADQLAALQKDNPDAFWTEFRKVMREQFGQGMRERAGERQHQAPQGPNGPQGPWMGNEHGGPGKEMIRERMQEKQTEYLEWLKQNYPDESEKLSQLQTQNPDHYMRALGISLKKYGPIMQASKDNPQLAAVLKDNLILKGKRDELLRQIRGAADETKKKELTRELEGVVGRQFDLIVKRKQIAYEDLLKKLEEMRKEVEQRKVEVEKWKSAEFKQQSVKDRIKELVSQTEKFEWD